MTSKECLQLLGMMRSLFPNEKQMTDEDIKVKAMFWADIMKDISYQQALEGLRHYAATSTTGFAPQPAHILNYARHKNKLTDAEIERYLLRALSNSTYNSEAEFERLPEDIKKLVGSPAELRSQATRETDDTRIYIKSVCKEYRARVDGGTLDNTLIMAGDEAARIAGTIRKVKAIE